MSLSSLLLYANIDHERWYEIVGGGRGGSCIVRSPKRYSSAACPSGFQKEHSDTRNIRYLHDDVNQGKDDGAQLE